MGKVIMCVGKTANIPYDLHTIGTSIYTIEELCFLFREETFLIDDKLVCRSLIDWIREELNLTELADSLYAYLRAKSSVSAFASAILEYVGYYPPAEIKQIETFLKNNINLDVYEKMKNIADYLAQGGKSWRAIRMYHELIAELPEDRADLKRKAYHNLGCACAQLFLFDKAAMCFETAYRLGGEERDMKDALAARRMSMNEVDYVNYVTDHASDFSNLSLSLEKKIEGIHSQWNATFEAQELARLRKERDEKSDGYEETVKSAVNRMKDKYRNMTRE